MTEFSPCTTCQRHYRIDQKVCPFCDSESAARRPLAPVRPNRPIARLAGAALTLTVAQGCGEEPTGSVPGDTGTDAGMVVIDQGTPRDIGPQDVPIVGDVYGLPADVGPTDLGADAGD